MKISVSHKQTQLTKARNMGRIAEAPVLMELVAGNKTAI